jgi:putative membrane protein
VPCACASRHSYSFDHIMVALMILLKKICLNTLLAFSALTCTFAMADDTVDAKNFVEEASAKGLAEIESSKLALNKSNTPAVRKFAEAMIADHTKANEELAAIARSKKLKVSDEPELLNKAKAKILKQRDGQSFDEAYANNQVMAHEQTLELFQKAANSKDAEVKAFARKTLPKLQHHLEKARELQANTKVDRQAVLEDE